MLSVLLAQAGGGSDINWISQLTGGGIGAVGIWLYIGERTERRELQKQNDLKMTSLVEKCVTALTESTGTLKAVQTGMAEQVVQARTTGPALDSALAKLDKITSEISESLPPIRPPRRRGET